MGRSSSEAKNLFFISGIAALGAVSWVFFGLARAISPAFSPIQLNTLNWIANTPIGFAEAQSKPADPEKALLTDTKLIQRRYAQLYSHKYPAPVLLRVVASSAAKPVLVSAPVLVPDVVKDEMRITTAHPETPQEAPAQELKRIQELHRQLFSQFKSALIKTSVQQIAARPAPVLVTHPVGRSNRLLATHSTGMIRAKTCRARVENKEVYGPTVLVKTQVKSALDHAEVRPIAAQHKVETGIHLPPLKLKEKQAAQVLAKDQHDDQRGEMSSTDQQRFLATLKLVSMTKPEPRNQTAVSIAKDKAYAEFKAESAQPEVGFRQIAQEPKRWISKKPTLIAMNTQTPVISQPISSLEPMGPMEEFGPTELYGPEVPAAVSPANNPASMAAPEITAPTKTDSLPINQAAPVAPMPTQTTIRAAGSKVTSAPQNVAFLAAPAQHQEQPPVHHQTSLPEETRAKLVQKEEVAQIPSERKPSAVSAPQPFFVEAFDWAAPIPDARLEAFSKQGESQSGWNIARSENHWPTLAWIDGDLAISKYIPLISKNSAKILSALGTAEIQNGAGIVFGKIPAGWNLEFSARAERPIFLNEKSEAVSAYATEHERYFAFLNAEPGAQLLYLTGNEGKLSGAVAVPVLAGTATYVDATVLSLSDASGMVVDASANQPVPMKAVNVRVVGQANAITWSDAAGKFTFKDIVTVGSYPIYFETEAQTGYTHRYHFMPSQLKSLKLYRLSDAQIQSWLNQLEGGVSPASGLIVGAVPALAEKHPDEKLVASVHTALDNSSLSPETYSLSAEGQLQVQKPLDSYLPRFIGAQVPEGPALATVENTAHQILWSELTVVSPGVVSLLGPN